MSCRSHLLFSHGETTLERISCNGIDSPRPGPQGKHADELVVTLQGRFSVRHRRGQMVADPTRAVMFGAHHEYATRHPDGGDEGLVVRNPALAAAVDPWRTVPLRAEAQVRLYNLVTRLERGPVEPLEVEELLASVFDLDGARPRGTARARAVADELAHELAAHFDQPLSLAELSGKVGLSPFAATRLFRAATGWTIHQYQLELRLRHALALLHETDRPLAEIALVTGFANQGHLGNHFRRRYGLPPGQARIAAGRGSLVALLAR